MRAGAEQSGPPVRPASWVEVADWAIGGGAAWVESLETRFGAACRGGVGGGGGYVVCVAGWEVGWRSGSKLGIVRLYFGVGWRE